MEAPRSAPRERERERARTTSGGRRDEHSLWRVSWWRRVGEEGRRVLVARGRLHLARVAVRGLYLSPRPSERGGSVQEQPGAWTSRSVSSGENRLGCKLSLPEFAP